MTVAVVPIRLSKCKQALRRAAQVQGWLTGVGTQTHKGMPKNGPMKSQPHGILTGPIEQKRGISVEHSMVSHMSYRDVQKLVRSQSDLSHALDTVSKIMGVVLLLSPVALGPAAAVPVLGLFEAKNELVKLSKELGEKILKKKNDGYLEQSRALAAAHCVLTFTAFFEALNDEFPSLMKKIKISNAEKNLLVVRTARLGPTEVKPDGGASNTGVDHTATEIMLPHPAAPRADITQRNELYGSMCKAFQRFIEGLAIWEQLRENERAAARASLRKIPDLANAHYNAQYFALVSQYPRFSAWANLNKHIETQAAVENLADKLDLGFGRVERLIERLPGLESSSNSRAQIAAQALQTVYRERIAEPVIDDQYVDEAPSIRLSYPTKSDIFVPQAFKVVRHDSPSVRLENPDLWSGAAKNDDLGDFLMRYLESPYSVACPLLILGHPGSGKSLLTEIIAARLKPPSFNTVRVVLRDIDPDDDPQAQIEKQIRADTGEQVSWPEFSSDSRNNPPLVVLDGYDELLQANGKVFSTYLAEVQRFQRREATLNRPVRIVVTSRLTLIDKAKIPSGTTAVRLLEFDSERRGKWADIWNSHNKAYFSSNDIRPFAPGDNPQILNLAEHPLLLLMLALYDSQENQLSKNPKIDQMRLYHSLLTRFIERERGKDADFIALTPAQQAQQVDQDLERLGVAAVSMFNRQGLHILRDDLERDINYFEVAQEQRVASGVLLTQADLLLGSFFFIHQSRSRSGDSHDDAASRPTAFEFLHNTFGEFLCADFILRQVLRETKTIGTLSGNPQLASTLDQRLNSVEERWFACLIHTALHTRPAIVTMLREWSTHCLQADGRPRESFLAELDLVVHRQLRLILVGETPPTFTHREREVPYQRLALLGHLAIYSLNLVILRSILSSDQFVFDERALIPDAPLRPWDRLTHLWRSWIATESLVGIGHVVKARRRGSAITITPSTAPNAPSNESRLSSIFSIADTLADDVLAGLAAFQLTRSEMRNAGSPFDEYVWRLHEVSIHL